MNKNRELAKHSKCDTPVAKRKARIEKKSKVILTSLVLSFLAMTFMGCNYSALPESPTFQETEATEALEEDNQHTTDQNPDVNPASTKRVGQDGHGYITIPDYWATFQDLDPMPGVISYTNGGGAIVSLNVLPDTTDPYTAISNIAAHHEDQGAEGVTAANVTLNGEAAYQVYCCYAADDIFVVTWVFKGSDGNIHYVCAEAPSTFILETVAIVEDTYSFTE